MTTDAQKRANQQNAQRSTGPQTEDGVVRSSRNALTHGGYATKPDAIPSGELVEDPLVVRDFVERIVGALQPANAIERELAMRIAVLFLRLRRVSRLEVVGLCESDVETLLHVMDVVSRIDSRTARELQAARAEYRETRERREQSVGWRLAHLMRDREITGPREATPSRTRMRTRVRPSSTRIRPTLPDRTPLAKRTQCSRSVAPS